MDSSHDLCFEEYLKCQGFPHSTQNDGLCRSPLSEVDPELLPAQLASPLTLPGESPEEAHQCLMLRQLLHHSNCSHSTSRT